MRRAAVLGRPVEHSLSPLLHRAAYAELGLDWSYDAIDCGVADLESVLAARTDWAGFSCTMPLKHAALGVAGEVSAVAVEVGAANTLLPVSGGGWLADNTDVAGVLGALGSVRGAWSGVTVLGAGGTAQAVVIALAHIGIGEIDVLVRDAARAAALHETADRASVRLRVAGLEPSSPALGADLVLSTLPPGAADAYADRAWSAAQTVLDVVYDPWPTRLASAAAAGGAEVVSGAVMLVHQAAEQVRLMTGHRAPLDIMRAALRNAPPARGL